jgi:hypothetical protein
MDNQGDNYISFDDNGNCNYCNEAIKRKDSEYFPNDIGKQKLEQMLSLIKKKSKNKKYDCLMGISGGLDSSYLAYIASQEWGLRILAVHINDGFNSPVADENIKKLIDSTNIDLVTINAESAEYYNLVKSFILAEVPNIAIPQDNVLLAYIRIFARKHKIKYSILQRGNTHIAADKKHILAVHKEFGDISIKKLPLISIFDRYVGQKYIRKMLTFRPLDLIEYDKEKAIQMLNDNIGYNYYEGKHYESIFTRFMQSYYLPLKFNVDKRKSHLSSLIISNQMSRDNALNELEKPLYIRENMEKDIDFVLKKIHLSRTDFDNIMENKGKLHSEYRTSILYKLIPIARKLRKFLSS